MSDYQRQVLRMYMLPVLASAGVFCTTLVASLGEAPAISLRVWLIAAGQAIGVLSAGLAHAYLNPPTPPSSRA